MKSLEDPPEEITISVPGTSANLGPGYDCLGLAIGLANETMVKRARRRKSMPEMVEHAAGRFFDVIGRRPFGFDWAIDGAVPRSRGLGSSVTVRLGLLHGLNELAGKPCDRQQIFELCAELEGHPDNAAPAEFGGFVVATGGGRKFRFPVDDRLKVVLLIPDFEVETEAARQVIPDQVAHCDAAANAARAAAITAAFASRKYALLTGLFDDALHQPFRAPLVPGLEAVIAAGKEAGALGGFLSGSGSTIACLTVKRAKKVAQAMSEAMQQARPDAAPPRIEIVTADNRGSRILTRV